MDTNNSQFLAEKLAKSEARRYVDRLITLQKNYYVFDQNYQDLVRILDSENREKEMLVLWNLQNRASFVEILRLLHNFIASAQSLVDQTRVCINMWYKGTEFLEEYQVQVNSRFLNNPIAGFIQDLRNYNLHRSLPVTSARFTISEQKTLSFSFVLVKSAILDWDGWKQRGKKYLDTAEDQIDIRKLANSFHDLEFDFQEWLFARVIDIHREDLEWYSSQSQMIMNNLDDEEKEERGYL